jgi:D-alanine transaminase
MADILWFDGRFTTTDEPVLTVQDRGLLFGDAVYEVLKYVDRAPILIEAHWRRLCRSLSLLEIDNPWTASSFEYVIAELLRRAEHGTGIVYLEVTRGGGPRAHAWDDAARPVGFMYAGAFRFPDETMLRDGVGVVLVPETRWSRCEIKSVNLLPNVIAKKAARRADAYEAVFVDGERIIEGSSSNVFLVLEDRIVTHPREQCLLPGTRRDAVLTLAQDAGLEVDERPPLVSELTAAREAFLTSTTSFVLPITRVDGRPVGGGKRGAVTERLQRRMEERERRDVEAWVRARSGS